jgi:predicted amidohydrolase
MITYFKDFGRIGIGICYDVRFPEMAMIAARKGKAGSKQSSSNANISLGCIAMIYPGKLIP